MKVMKAMKKLKFWSRKKRKRKQSCSSPPHHCSYEYTSMATAVVIEPTAPPLPFWFDETQSHYTGDTSAFSWNNDLPDQREETIVETTPLLSRVSDVRIYQYQQSMVPNQTCGVPIGEPADAARVKRSAGIFGCVIEFSSSLVRCFFP